jgi:hypothetical protein
VALAVGFAGVTASSAATTPAPPKQHAAKRLSLLVKHTRKLPGRLVKERHKRTLVRLAKSAERSSGRRPAPDSRRPRRDDVLGVLPLTRGRRTRLNPRGYARRMRTDLHPGGERRAPEHCLYHLLGDPSAGAWVSTPVRIDISKINVELIPIPTPGPGGPVTTVFEQDEALPAEKAIPLR